MPVGPTRSERPVRVLILGDHGALGQALLRKLELAGAEGAAVSTRRDADLADMLVSREWTAAAILTHDDVLALRLTLLCAHLRPELPLWVTLFDKTILHQLGHVTPAVHVVSSAELVAQRLDEHCAFLVVASSNLRRGTRLVDDALRLMFITGLGLLVTLVVQTAISILALHQGLVNALYFSTRTIATVADSPNTSSAPDWFKIVSVVTTVIAVVLVAIFTAALVRRLSRRRLTTLFGRRRAPARGHVLLVGFGQVAFRLAQNLQRRGVGVIAVERDAEAPCVRLARGAGIPVAIGRGDDRATLELLGVGRCAAVAAVTSDDLVNVAVGLAATDVRPGVPLILRLGDGEVAAETESLLHLGRICDAHDVVASHLVLAICADESVVAAPVASPLS
jgi:voltage-gated potassium channel Kch